MTQYFTEFRFFEQRFFGQFLSPITRLSQSRGWLASALIGLLAALLMHFSREEIPATISAAYQGLLIWQFTCVWLAGTLFFSQLLTKLPAHGIGGLWVFSVVSLYCLFWLPLGFDVTDEGTRLALSKFLFADEGVRFLDFKFGTHLAYHYWLSLWPGQSLIWSRLAFVAVQAGIATVAYQLVRTYSQPRWAFAASVVAGTTVTIYAVQTLNYNNFPVLLSLLAIWLFQLGIRPGKKPIYLLVSGVFFLAACIARFPLASLLPLPLVYLCMLALKHKTWKAHMIQASLLYGGALLLALAFILVLIKLDGFDDYLSRIQKTLIDPYLNGKPNAGLKVHYHDRQSLARIYSKDFIFLWQNILALGWPLLVVIGIFFLRIRTLSLLACIGLASYWLASYTPAIWDDGILSITLFFLLITLFRRTGISHAFFPLFWGLSLCVLSFVGSNFGIRNMVMTGGVTFILAFVLASVGDPLSRKRWFAFSGSMLAVMTFMLLVVQVWNMKKGFIYRDKDAHELTEMFESPALWGLFTHEDRRKVTDDMLFAWEAIQAEHQPQTLLCVNTNPMFQFLLDTPPGERFFWKLTDLKHSEKDDFFASEKAPELLFTSRLNARDRAWPTGIEPCHHSDTLYFSYYDSLLQSNTVYQPVYKNRMFELYVPSAQD